jgi:hypothetical protein
MARFLVKVSYPHKLAKAPDGAVYLNDPPETVQQRQDGLCRQLRGLPLEQSPADTCGR